jgi:hypothetical protein
MFAKVQLAPSHWSLLGSIIAHAVILWFIMRVPIFNPLLPPFPFSVRLADEFTQGREATPSENPKLRGAGRKLEESRHQSTAPQSSEQNSGSGAPRVGSDAASGGLGNIATDPGGIALGGGLSTGSAVGSMGKGSPSGTGSGGATSDQVKSAPAGGRDRTPAASVIATQSPLVQGRLLEERFTSRSISTCSTAATCKWA